MNAETPSEFAELKGAPTPIEFAARMQRIAANDDTEGSHVEADRAVAALLRKLGYGKAMRIYTDMPKWYA